MNRMSTLYLVLTLLCLASFLVPIALAGFHWVRGQGPLALRFVQLNGGFALFVGALFLVFLLLENAPDHSARIETFFDSLFFLLYSVMLWLVSRFLFELLQRTWEGWRRTVTIALGWLGPVLLFLVNSVVFEGQDRVVVLRYVLNGLYLPLFLGWVLYAFALAFLHRKRVSDPWKKRTLLGACLVFFGGIPLFVVDAFWPLLQLEWNWIPRGVNLHLVVFLAWNAFFSVQWFAFSSRPTAPDPGAPTPRLAEHLFPTLTVRERQVTERILAGRTNLEIAQEFGISPGTTKNHVYSIFNKTGASSRKELVRMAAEDSVGPASSPSR